MAKSATRQVSIFINGQAVENSVKGISDAMRQSNNELKRMVIGSDQYVAKLEELNKLKAVLDDHKKRLSGVSGGFNLLKSTAGQFASVAAGAFTIDAVIRYGAQLLKTGAALEALERKAQTVFKEALPGVTRAAEENARAMGLTNSQYVSAAANIQDLLVPMGFQRQAAADISTQLVNLSGALSEWTGGQRTAQEVTEILSDALLGERESLKGLGIDLQQADIDARLAAQGLSKLGGESKRQAEAAATLQLILQKSSDAQIAYAENSGSAVRSQAELSAKITEITEKLSRVLLPVFDALATVLSFQVDMIDKVVSGFDELMTTHKSAADGVRDLQAEFNTEIEVLTRGNFTQKERAQLIGEINQKYAPYLGNLLSEKASLEEIEAAQKRANKAFLEKIIYIETEKEIAALQEATAKAATNSYEAQKRLNEEFSKTQDISSNGPVMNTELLTADLGKVLDEVRETGIKAVNEFDSKRKAIFDKAKETAESLGADFEKVMAQFASSPTGGGGVTELSEEAKKEAQRLQDELRALLEKTTQIRLELQAKAGQDELALAILQIEQRYDAEIKKAVELEKKGVAEATAQRIALEEFKAIEIGRISQQFYDAEVEKAREAERAKAQAQYDEIVASEEFLAQRDEERRALQEELDAFNNEALLSKRELELLELETHYNNLLTLADDYGLNITNLTSAYEKKRTEIMNAENEERKKFEVSLAEQRAQLVITQNEAIGQGAAILGGFFEKTSAVGKALFLVEKIAAAQAVILNAQKEKAGIYAAARLGTLFDPTGAAALALAAPQVAAVNIRQGISLATIAATAIKAIVPQKAEGGYHDVVGASDGRSYRARNIGSPGTGLLPAFPVLLQSRVSNAPVLASERGAEYFVAAHDMANPVVANLVGMIDAATNGRRVRQFADGGANLPTAAATTLPDPGNAAMMELASATKALSAILQQLMVRGIPAVLQDETIVKAQQRFDTINNLSGGYYK